MRMLVTIAMLAACTCYGAGWNDAAWSNEYPTAAVYQNIYSATVERAVAAGVLTVNTGFPLRAPAVVLHSIVPSNTVCVTNFIGTNEYVVCWTNYTLNLVQWTNTDWQTTFYKVIDGSGYGTFFTIDYPSKAYLKAIYDVLAASATKFMDMSTNTTAGGSLDEWFKAGYKWDWGTNKNPGCAGGDGWSLIADQRDRGDVSLMSLDSVISNTQSGADLVRYTVDTNTQEAVLYGYQDDPPDYCTYSFTNTYYGTTNWTHNWQLTIAATSPASWWLGGQRCMVSRTFSTTSAVAGVTNITRYNVLSWSNFYGSTIPHGQMQYGDWPIVNALSLCSTNATQAVVTASVYGQHSRRDGVIAGNGGLTGTTFAVTWNSTQTLSKLFSSLVASTNNGIVGNPSYTNVVGAPSMLGASIDYFVSVSNMALYGAATGGVLCATTLSEIRDCLNAMQVIARLTAINVPMRTQTKSESVDFVGGGSGYVTSCDPSTTNEYTGGDTCEDTLFLADVLFDCTDSSDATISYSDGVRIGSIYNAPSTWESEWAVNGPWVFTQMYASAGGYVDVYFYVQPYELPDLCGSGLTFSEYIDGPGASYYAWRRQVSQAIAPTTVVSIATGIVGASRPEAYCDGDVTMIRASGFLAGASPDIRRGQPLIVVRPSFVYTEE